MSEKTEQPTEKKKQDSRKKGQTLQSKELTMFSAIASLVIYLVFNWKTYLSNLVGVYSLGFENYRLHLSLGSIIATSNSILIHLILPPVAFAAIVSLFVNIVQMGGIVIAAEAMVWKLDKFNIVNNAKNIFAKKNLIKFFKSNLEVVCMLVVSTSILYSNFTSILNSSRSTLAQGTALLLKLSTIIVSVLLLIYFIFALLEYLVEMMHLRKELMMTLEEVKNEFKSTEGSPEMKHARKEFHKSLLEEDPPALGDATMVLSNPTHIAILIFYSPKKYIAPFIKFKASGSAARAVFRIARKNKIPIIQNIWLARQLYEIAIVGQPVPPSLSKYLAEVFKKHLHLFPQVKQELLEVLSAPKQQPKSQTTIKI